MRVERPLGIAVSMIVAGLVLLSDSREVQACTCLPATFEEEFNDASAVFSGTVIDIREANADELAVRLIVDACWKGALSDTAEVRTGKTGAVCGFGFELGKPYIVFSFHGTTTFCDRTHETWPEDPMLEELGPPKSVPSESRTWGRVKAVYR